MRTHLARLAALAGPVYAELLSGVVASVIGAFWVAGLGGAAVAAVTLAGTVENLLLGLVLVVASGTSLRLSRALGAGDRAGAARTARAAWRLCVLVTVAIAVPGFLLRDRLAAGFLEGPAAGLAADYFAVAFPAFGLFSGQRVADELFKGAGDTRTPMRIALLSNALLLGLDPLLVLGAGLVPGLGVTGAALALTTSRAVALAVTLRLLAKRRTDRSPEVVGPENVGPERVGPEARRIVRAGAPFGLDFTARMAVGTAQLALVAGFGVSAVAGYGIGYRVLLVVTMAFYALRQAAAIEAARLVGAGGGAELRELAHATGRFAAVLGAGAAVSAVLLAGPVSGLFTDDLAVTAQSAGFLRMTAPYLLPYALVVALGGVHQAVGAGRALVVSVALGLAAQLGSAAVLSGPLGVNGVWAGLTVGAVVQLALLRMLTRRRTTPPTSGHRTDRTSRSDRSGGSGRSGRSGHPDPGVALDAAAGRRGPAQAVLRPRRFPGAGVAAE